ncbi:MAG: putative porin, partial [Thermodesulfobacteriota bacterium]|nr:putative porin [Thermodesulfobacteriota bacterium]
MTWAPQASAASINDLERQVEALKDRLIDLQSQLNDVRSETKKASKTAKKASESGGVPKWAKNWKFKGDFRLRYQSQEEDEGDSRTRLRYRLRPGVEAQVNDWFKVGFRLVSGGAGHDSTNETLDDNFDMKDVSIDLAYAELKPVKQVAIIGGKMNNPLWKTKDLMWDGDITPEGIAAKIKFKPAPALEIFLTPAYWILDDQRRAVDTGVVVAEEGDDPKMMALQAGLKYGGDIYVKAAVTKYGFDKVQGFPGLNNGRGTNTMIVKAGTGTDVYRYDYDVLSLDAEVGFKLPIEFMPQAAVFGTWVENPDPEEDNNGYLYGFRLGHKKVKKLGQWQFKYNYRYLETDAWLDQFPDSDAYGGETNKEGSEFEIKFGLAKNTTIGLDYYDMKTIEPDGAGVHHDE